MKPAGAAPNDHARTRLAIDPRTADEMLAGLSSDPSPTVRAAVALNPRLCDAAMDALDHDPDERVRALLARNLAMLVPRLGPAPAGALVAHARAVLLGLARDESIAVRLAIAEVVQTRQDAPPALIRALARDTASAVSDAVIRLSPLLTEADLIALIVAPPTEQTMLSVARRPNLPESVSEEIVASARSDAIRALLDNTSARVREATLDALVAHAPGHPDWHGALVRRPGLSGETMAALARFVSDIHLRVLADRTDIPSDLLVAIRARLDAPSRPAARGAVTGNSTLPTGIGQISTATGALEEALSAVLARNALQAARRMLATAAGIAPAAVDHACLLRDPRMVCALAWRAGLTAAFAAVLQRDLGGVAPDDILSPTLAGEYRLSPAELRHFADRLQRS